MKFFERDGDENVNEINERFFSVPICRQISERGQLKLISVCDVAEEMKWKGIKALWKHIQHKLAHEIIDKSDAERAACLRIKSRDDSW